jgi:hypothetical protein
MAGDFSLDGVQNDADARNRIVEGFQTLHADLKEGKRTQSELDERAKKVEADFITMDRELAELKAAASVRDASARRDGPEGELRQFVSRDATQGSERVRLFGGKVKFAGQDVGQVEGLLTSAKTYGDWHKDAKDLFEAAVICAAVRRKGKHEELGNPHTLAKYAPKTFAKLGYHLSSGPGEVGRQGGEWVERVFTDSAGVGAEFIPDITLAELDKALALSDFGLVGDTLATRPMEGKNLIKPFLSTNPRPYLYGDITTDDPSQFTRSTPGTGSNTIDAKGFAINIPMDRDAIDDSIVQALPEMRELIVRGHMLGREEALFHADTAATHQDTGIGSWNVDGLWETGSTFGGSGDIRRAWLGLRARAHDLTTAAELDMSTFTYATLLQLAELVAGPKGLGPANADMVLAVGYAVYLGKIMGLAETKTVDVYGPKAAILGNFPAVVGPWAIATTPMLPSEFNASGLYDGTTTTKGVVCGFLRNRFNWYSRRSTRVELDTDIKSGIVNLVATQRLALHTPDAASVANVVNGYNI